MDKHIDGPFVRLIALGIVGGVAKALFSPAQINYTAVANAARDTATKVASAAGDAAKG